MDKTVLIDYTELRKQIENSYCSSKVSKSVALKLLKHLEESKVEGEIELKYKKLKSLTMIDIKFHYSFSYFFFCIELTESVTTYFKIKLDLDPGRIGVGGIKAQWIFTIIQPKDVPEKLNQIKLTEEIYTKI